MKTIPTEPIGSIPRPLSLIGALAETDGTDPALDPLYDEAIRDTIERFEATGSPVITDGEQRKYHNFWTYCVQGLPNTAPDGFKIPFSAGHTRRMLRLTAGPFRYRRHADSYLEAALKYASRPVKQAVISPSALSLMYPPDEIPGYPRQRFIEDLLREHETEVRNCLRKGAHSVQVDFTEGRLAVKIDPSGELLHRFIDLNNLALTRFSAEDRRRIGVHTCPGSDRDSTHSGDVDYALLLPSLFQLRVGNFYVALAGETDRGRVLEIIRRHVKPGHRIFVGVIDPIDPRVETPEEVRDRVLEAARYIPVDQLVTCDDCGFSPFCDDTTTTRETAFEKIRARVVGTALAAERLGGDDGEPGRRGGATPDGRTSERSEHPRRPPGGRGGAPAAVRVAAGDARQHRRRGDQHRRRGQGHVPERRRRGPNRLDEGGGRGPPAARGLPDRQRRDPPAGRESGAARPAGGDDRRAGQPHRPHRPRRDGAADRRQRRADPGRRRGQDGAVLVVRDVTERRKAENETRRKEAELMDFLENANVGLHWVGPDGILLWANRAELELLGYTREEYFGRHIAEFHADRPVIDDILRRLLDKEDLRENEARLICKDGSIRHVLINSSGLWEGGVFLHSRCFTHDITDRKQAEEARARLAAIVESSEDAIVGKTLEGIITSWNRGAERLFGYAAAEAVGNPITLIIPPERLDEEPAILERLRRGESRRSLRHRPRRQGRPAHRHLAQHLSRARWQGPGDRGIESCPRHHPEEAGRELPPGAGTAAQAGGRRLADDPLGGVARQRHEGHRGGGQAHPRRPPGGLQRDRRGGWGPGDQRRVRIRRVRAVARAAHPAGRGGRPRRGQPDQPAHAADAAPSWRPSRRGEEKAWERRPSLRCIAGWRPRWSAAAGGTWGSSRSRTRKMERFPRATRRSSSSSRRSRPWPSRTPGSTASCGIRTGARMSSWRCWPTSSATPWPRSATGSR